MKNGRVKVNGVELAYVEEGDGPLALLLHGFPESGAATYRHLVPALARAGYRAVAPNMRGFAPSALPVGEGILFDDLVADALGLHDAFDGDGNAVIVGHDWGAATTWAAVTKEPERWSRVVASDVPPLQFFAPYAATYEGIERLNHFWFFQMDLAETILAADDMAYLYQVMQRKWTGPDYDVTEDFEAAREALREPARLRAALSLYRNNFGPHQMGTPQWEAEQFALWGALPSQPTLYLHGTHDNSVALDQAALDEIEAALPEGSEAHFIQGAGHIVPAEKPDEYNARVIAFLQKDV
ncbi:alpha/beta fold hydrolase [Micromonospora chersina]|uniref:alpha/beta fold hydrolase n=1 Tax=Micromonospora chersina TaxID=47854 RepID=UPI0033F0F136